MMTCLRVGEAVAIACVALIAAGCNGGGDGCSEAGCDFPLFVTVFGESGSLVPSSVEVVLVLDGDTLRCPPVDPTFGWSECVREDGTGGVEMGQFDSDGEPALQIYSTIAPVSLTVSVLQGGQEVASYQKAPVQYSTYYPNGEDCEPQCRMAQVEMVVPAS